jgi:hypothetical protein
VTDEPTKDVAISTDRLNVCLRSARRWSHELPQFADRWQCKADFWAILAGILGAISGSTMIATMFAAAGDTESNVAKAVASACAVASSLCALVPRVKGYAEESGAARVLPAHYGSIYGRLLDLMEQHRVNEHAAQAIVTELQAVKEKKDLLRGLSTWKCHRPHPPGADAHPSAGQTRTT